MTRPSLLILALIATIEYPVVRGSFYGKMNCADCAGVNEKCNITTTGWSCDYELDAKKLIDKGDSSGIPESLRKCMLPGFEFKKKEALYGYCCFWSPKIGCQKLKKSDRYEDLCYGCTRATWLPVMKGTICPCGDWFMQTRNNEMMHKPWNYILITEILVIILNF